MTSVNMFIDNIYAVKRCKYRLIGKIKMYLFIRKLRKIVPDFAILWDIANTLKLMEIVYLYPNSQSERIHTIHQKRYKENENHFGINIDGHHEIAISLFAGEENTIKIETFSIKKEVRESISSIAFVDGCAEINSVHDEQLFININDWVMDAVIDLLKKYV